MATAEGTHRFLARAVQRGALHSLNVRPLRVGDGQLFCSSLGFGAYRVGGGDDAAAHLASVRAAIRTGVNLLDTSAHYSATKDGAHGESERLIGKAVAEAMQAGDAKREELILCTKVGHVARGHSPTPPDSVPVSPDGGLDDWHCIHPDFVTSEVMASKERLGTAPDFVLLHNPEYFLSSQLRAREQIATAWDGMYQRLEEAFKALEQLCQEGHIQQGYGVSGNLLSCMFSTTGRPNVYEALMLDRMLDAASAASSASGSSEKHRFRLVQMPLNAIEGGAVLGRGRAVPEAAEGDAIAAERHGVAVVTNRPLNALPLPGTSSGDWGRSSASYLQLKDTKPLGTIQALLKRVLMEGSRSVDLAEAASVATSLQHLALKLVSSAPGVSCSLCGMRRTTYVEESAAVMQEPPLSTEEVQQTLSKVRSLMEELGAEHKRFWS